MDNGVFEMYNGLVTDGWQWIKFNDHALTEGEHTLAIGYREDGAKLDKILVSNYPDLPVGPGNEAINICEIDPATSAVDAILDEEDNGYALWQNYPNPFHISTTIKYRLKKPVHVYLCIYDLNGQETETIVDQYQSAGRHVIVWRAEGLPGGVYFYRLLAGETKKLILQK
jgi:hypothetical protein